jgi:MerR family transcriptional regulator/heat shock protein HspR
MISVVARRFAVHPQTLRLYEREGFLKPSRTDGNTRLYSDADLETLSFILNLTRDLGVNLAGVEVIMNMRHRMHAMQEEVDRFIASLRDEMARRQQGPETASRSLVRQAPGRIIKVEKG